MLDLKTDKLCNSGTEDKGRMFNVLQVLGMNEDLFTMTSVFKFTS